MADEHPSSPPPSESDDGGARDDPETERGSAPPLRSHVFAYAGNALHSLLRLTHLRSRQGDTRTVDVADRQRRLIDEAEEDRGG